MKTSLVICFALSVSVLSNGLHVLGPSGPLAIQPGGSVMLSCYVQTPIPVEELEVEWRRTDSETIVHLFQDGESQPESQDQAYHDRAHFFIEDIARGNFSLLLTDVTTKDTGLYKCVVYRNQESNETLIEIKMSVYLTVSGGHVVSVYAGEDTTLNCSVHSHIPPEELEEVSWKKRKTDEDMVVFQFINGQTVPESIHEAYRDRVELFSREEIHKGNFSLRLKNIQIEDKGFYICEVFHEDLSANTTVEVQQLGFSSMHTGVLCFCILAFVLLPVLGYAAYTSIKNNKNTKSDLALQCTFVCCPTIALAVAFILWGVTEGFLAEVATCSALNLLRILSLLWVTSHFKTFPENIRRFIKKTAVSQGYALITAVIYSGLVVHNWHKYEAIQSTNDSFFMVLSWPSQLFLLLLLFFLSFHHKGSPNSAYACICINNLFRIFMIMTWYSLKSIANFFLGCILLLPLCWLGFQQGVPFLTWISVLCILEFLSTVISVYLHNELLEGDKERVALTCATTYLHILSLTACFKYLDHLCESNSISTRTWLVRGSNSNHDETQRMQGSNSNDTETEQSPGQLYTIVHMLGAVGLICVNSISLIAELILKTRNGERTLTDLRVILLPSECVFAICCLALAISAFCHAHYS
ncbi:uncharacterized protein LOC113568944 isoform X5 [Electrophorus electricus]|uniref:uncharacterized protein LOC113568944 isoform X5 n=1 Tax=Electrophorus electricus TaxID=8005 RepID=UPI0015D01A6F|nr:uncharacterized protein LOC113568944 isoform X5 [Electrophorus electricus]